MDRDVTHDFAAPADLDGSPFETIMDAGLRDRPEDTGTATIDMDPEEHQRRIASTIVLALPTTESMITGMSGSISRMRASVPIPSSPGIITSRITMSGDRPDSSRARARFPSSAVSTW